ncbi:MAG: CPBP family intramembrane glutamic endopeptidase [Balneolaceae bacterium]|nr:CPBP family intramembrane glutamic endopeptidase [Balneolaceae bacterium]
MAAENRIYVYMQEDRENQSGKVSLEEGLNLNTRELLAMSLGSLVFYFFVSTILYYFVIEESLFSVFFEGSPIWEQTLVGLGAGILCALIILFFSTRPPMKSVLDDFVIFRIISRSRFSLFDKVQISFFAGLGEELLFRGTIQPLIGIWLTSVLFIAIHGYISIKSAGHILFTVLLLGLSVVLGFLFELSGIIAAMTAHASYDFIMLFWASRRQTREEE